MAKILSDVSRTFNEFLLIPGLTTKKHLPNNVDLRVPISAFQKRAKPAVLLNLPIVSSAMQSVSGVSLCSEISRLGAAGFVFSSQTIESQALMVSEIAKTSKLPCAAINTHDYLERSDAIVKAGAKVLCIDSSDGYSEWQTEASKDLKRRYGNNIVLGGGNVVTAEAFEYLVLEGQLDFVKVGIGGGSICITREQKGIGRGQASALIEVAAARDAYFAKTGRYVPICSDGGISSDTHLIIALALGADFVMMGRYFAGTDESPNPVVQRNGKNFKAYWGEGSLRARNWQRYKQSDENRLIFEEGVDSYVPAVGPVAKLLETTITKLKSTMCNLGALSISELHEKAILTVVSDQTFIEGGTSSVEVVTAEATGKA